MHQFPVHTEHTKISHSLHTTVTIYVQQQWLFKQHAGIAEKIVDAVWNSIHNQLNYINKL